MRTWISGQDLAITTDFRTVLGEIVVRRLGNTKLGAVFPGITPEIYSPATKLNIVNGPDPEPDYTSAVGQVFMPLLSARRCTRSQGGF